MTTATTAAIKFAWNGLKIGGRLYRAFYSDGQLTNHPAGTISVYLRDYERLPRNIPGLTVHNDSDMTTDYFETDTIRIIPGSQHYDAARAAMAQRDAHHAKLTARRLAGRKAA